MASGWVRFQGPAGIVMQVGVNAAQVGPFSMLGKTGDGNIFSSWTASDVDTIFYAVNHSGNEAQLEHRWFSYDGQILQDTFTTIQPFNSVQIPASAFTAHP